VEFNYFGTTVKIQKCIQEEIERECTRIMLPETGVVSSRLVSLSEELNIMEKYKIILPVVL
jgi:hypothetical protein